ncbi:hypothetical protein NVRI1_00190 [Chlamydia abortus]|nr:hypothetical protein NVRI1_00190 [Chlamydia abortus]
MVIEVTVHFKGLCISLGKKEYVLGGQTFLSLEKYGGGETRTLVLSKLPANFYMLSP